MPTTQQFHELPAQYDPGQTERAIYDRWVEAGIFSADEKRSNRNGGDREPFVIVMPPPNVTAVLHMGHGLNNTVQDVIIRWRRMRGAASWPSETPSSTGRSSSPSDSPQRVSCRWCRTSAISTSRRAA